MTPTDRRTQRPSRSLLSETFLWFPHLPLNRLLKHQSVRQIIDVLAGACKVGELKNLVQLCVLAEVVLEHIFNGLDIMVGRLLDIFDLRRCE